MYKYPEKEELDEEALEKILADMDDLEAQELAPKSAEGVTITIAVEPGVSKEVEELKEEAEEVEGAEEMNEGGKTSSFTDEELAKLPPFLRKALRKK